MTQNARRLIPAALLAGLLAFLGPPQEANAQFLNKLTKGLEKVNKAIDKVTGTTTNNKSKESTKENSKASTSQTTRTAGENSVQMKKVENAHPTPVLADTVRMMKVNSLYDPISNIHDGVFCVRENFKFAFYLADGRKLFAADWEYCGDGETFDPRDYEKYPIFVDGVCAARRVTPNAAGKKVVCLLYKDGSVKELSPNVKTVTVFKDGLAFVEEVVNYKSLFYYINLRGEKVFPSLKLKYSSALGGSMRPLCDGLRAFPSADDHGRQLWGYIDRNGTVVIPPSFKNARDFSEGLAWVELKPTQGQFSGESALIDTKGNVVFRSGKTLELTKLTSDYFTDVHDGMFYFVKDRKGIYYDKKGTELKAYEWGSGFYGGYTFVNDGREGIMDLGLSVLNSKFERVGRITEDYFSNAITASTPYFGSYGLATISSGDSYIITPNGRVVTSSLNVRMASVQSFTTVSADGYFKAKSVEINGERYVGIVNVEGEIVWLFYTDSGGRDFGGKPIPQPIWPWWPRDPPVIPDPPTDPPIGPKIVNRHAFKVNVIASPAEGGRARVSPSTSFQYGGNATISASVNEDWAVSYVETSYSRKKKIELGKPFSVTADQTVTVHFLKEEKEEAPRNSDIYEGTVLFAPTSMGDLRIPVYAEISKEGNISSPYGEKTYGFLVPVFDPNEPLTDKNGEIRCNFFAAPLQIVGYQHDETTGKHWLLLDGGSLAAGNVEIATNDMVGNLWFNFLLGINDYTTVNATPHRYRLEMLDIDSSTGEFTCGTLQVYSPKGGGWVPGGDKSIRNTTHGFMTSKSEAGYSHDTFQEAQMKKAKKRNDITWYPPENWGKSKSGYQELINNLNYNYRNAKSEYRQLFGK